jgi:hypothetical protein
MSAPTRPLKSLTVQQAELTFGRGLVSDLVAKFGPLLADLLLKWLLKRQQTHPAPNGISRMNIGDARKFIAMLLRGNRDAILGFIMLHLGELLDEGADWLDTDAAPPVMP